MPDTFTAAYNLTKPEVNASRDTWGTKHNENMDKLDGALKALSDGKLSKTGGGTLSGRLHFDEQAYMDPTGQGDGLQWQAIDTVEMRNAALTALLPRGSIIMWWGNTIPAGWALCNGQNGTPAFLDRFPVAAGSAYALGAVGGGNTHYHGIQATALAVEHLPPHTHAVYDPSHTHGGAVSSHNHDYTRRTGHAAISYAPGGAYANQIWQGDSTVNTQSVAPGLSIYGAYTGISLYNTGSGWGHTHGMDAADHRPYYIGLYFIMKL